MTLSILLESKMLRCDNLCLVFFVLLEHSPFYLDVKFILNILSKVYLLDAFTRQHRCKGRSTTVKFLRRKVILAKYEYYCFVLMVVLKQNMDCILVS